MKVEVYYNLHKSCLSVRHKGKVVAHVSSIYLEDVKFVVQPAGRARVLSSKRKNVHAFLRGTWRPTFVTNKKGEAITYNPYKFSSFVLEASHKSVDKAGWAVIKDKKIYAGNIS